MIILQLDVQVNIPHDGIDQYYISPSQDNVIGPSQAVSIKWSVEM